MTTPVKPTLNVEQLIEQLEAGSDWRYPLEIEVPGRFEQPPRRLEVTGVRAEEREGQPAFRIVLETQEIDR